MEIGYLLGGVMSLIFYRISRQQCISILNLWLENYIRNKKLLVCFYALIISVLFLILEKVSEMQLINGIVIFSVIEISGSNLIIRHKYSEYKRYFYDALIMISRSFIATFITPLIIILMFGNGAVIAYTLFYYLSNYFNSNLGEKILNYIYIVSSIIGVGFLYVVYIFRNKTIKIDFRGEFLKNLLHMPLLNIYILCSYIESVNFYYIEHKEVVHYLRSYGWYQGKIDITTINDLFSIIYGTAGFILIIFIFLINII